MYFYSVYNKRAKIHFFAKQNRCGNPKVSTPVRIFREYFRDYFSKRMRASTAVT